MKQTMLFSFFCSSLLAVSLQVNATVRYVKTNGSTQAENAANATSWENACDDLQATVDACTSGDSVFVAVGTYSAGATHFSMKDGVQVFGGFPATGNPGLEDRKLPIHLTTNNESYLSILTRTGRSAILGMNMGFGGTVSTVWDGFVFQGTAEISDYLIYLYNNQEVKNSILK